MEDKDLTFAKVIRAKMKQQADALWQNFMPDFTPMFPWIFLYVLPKEQKIGHIWLPSVQNKITYEGIVLKTWKGPHLYKGHTYETQLQEGDHICFPHFAGQPVISELDKQFRLVKEYPIIWGKEGDYVDDIIFCKVNYVVKEHAKQFAKALGELTLKDPAKQAELLMENFVVIPKEPQTFSGQ